MDRNDKRWMLQKDYWKKCILLMFHKMGLKCKRGPFIMSTFFFDIAIVFKLPPWKWYNQIFIEKEKQQWKKSTFVLNNSQFNYNNKFSQVAWRQIINS